MTQFVAALPMYDWPEMRADTDAEWARLRDRIRGAGIDAPDALARRNGDLPPVPGGIRDAAGEVIAPDPATLPPDEFDLAVLWRHPKLLLGQTCWGPMEAGLEPHVVVVGQPSYHGLAGGSGLLYSSAIVMRRHETPPSGLPAISPSRGEIGSSNTVAPLATLAIGESHAAGSISPLEGEMAGRPEGGAQAPSADGAAILPLDLLRGRRFAFNNPDSMSGWFGISRDLEAAGEGIGIFSERIETGGHRSSIVAIAEDRADVAAIDCRSWWLAQRHEPRAAELQVVGWTALRKGLPMITSRRTPAEVVEMLKEVFGSEEG